VIWLGVVVSSRDDVDHIFQFGDPESALVEDAGQVVDAQALEDLGLVVDVFSPAPRIHADVIQVVHIALFHQAGQNLLSNV
jgi:hypothetical protein